MKMRILAMATALSLCCTTVLAATVGKPSVTPVQAELMADMHARLLKVGSTVYARVTADWQGTNCVLRNGATLEGHVIAVVPHTKTAKGSEVDLAFTGAQCGGLKMEAFNLQLAALAAPPQNQDLGIMSDHLPMLLTGGGQPGLYLMSSMRASAYVNIDLETQIYEFPVIPNMPMGYVSRIRGLKLNVGSGPDDSSVLTSADRDISLEKHTLLLLIPAQGTFPNTEAAGAAHPANSSDGSSASDTVLVPPPPPVDDIDLCAPPECSTALAAGDANDVGNASSTIATSQLGYASRPHREMVSFDHDEALAYLGPRELLVAFNPHKLMARHELGRSGKTVRMIHAAVVDTQTHQITHMVDWELPDNRQYIWPLTEGRVLVHVGSELRIYGTGLKILNRLSLDGPLAFVRVTPDANFIAIGIIHERHTPELHAQLSENLNADPEEDVNILVLNRNFETIAKSTTRSGMMAPTLLNEGQAKVQALSSIRYRITLRTWANQTKVVSQFNSSCTPEISSIAPDLIFLVSCDKETEGRGYRVLRTDGKVVLKGDSSLSELGDAAEGITDHRAFVVKTVQTVISATPGAAFRAEDLTSEELRVYRATDGKRLFGVHVGSPSSSRDGYALSPDGAQLAVLTRDQITLYSVPQN